MVSYCCVKGCRNNSNNKKKDPNSVTSFHAFPSNPELKLKWLRAIGRPNWDPPSHARICSAHFGYDQISHDSCRTRIKDEACPVNALPPNSNFEASNVEVCRICLATDVKMYSLQDGVLRTCIESIAGFNENYNIEGLPQFVCYECSARLIGCYNLIEKSMIAQATLLDIFAQNGQITKSLIKKQNRKLLNLVSTLDSYKISNDSQYTYDPDAKSSNLIKNIHKNIQHHHYFKTEDGLSKDIYNNGHEESFKIDTNKYEKEKYELDETICEVKDDIVHKYIENTEKDTNEDLKTSSHDQVMSDDSNDSDNLIFIAKDVYGDKMKNSEKPLKKKAKKDMIGLTPDEIKMQEYFDIVKLSFQEQIEEWNRTTIKRQGVGQTYRCEICSKTFAHMNTYRSHISTHDSERGKAECPICKLRFKNDILVNSHTNRTHAKKFYCKSCPKTFKNVGVAKKHHRRHAGHVYGCARCGFASAHVSALGAHVRARHAHALACARCGRAAASPRALRLHRAAAHRGQPETEGNGAYRCDQCDISFISEGARRVHLLTSIQHKKTHDLCDPTPRDPVLKNICKKCGQEFHTFSEMVAHTKSEHPVQKRVSWRLPDDSYPTQCEHCGEIVNNRKEHWRHVLRQHRHERESYRAVITAVCDTCGKGFQNPTKLHIHELRHGSPTVRCESCPRVFYDKYALARHAVVHEPTRPHVCRTCGRGFKMKGNLERHFRVHTGVTPYECTMCGKKFKYSTSVNLHVRTVHYKQPHPPRKKRPGRAAKDSLDINNDLMCSL